MMGFGVFTWDGATEELKTYVCAVSRGRDGVIHRGKLTSYCYWRAIGWKTKL